MLKNWWAPVSKMKSSANYLHVIERCPVCSTDLVLDCGSSVLLTSEGPNPAQTFTTFDCKGYYCSKCDKYFPIEEINPVPKMYFRDKNGEWKEVKNV
jgi:hypothetical protein